MKKANIAIVWQTLRILFGIIFILSGILKLIDLGSFASAITKFKILNPLWVPYVKVLIPVLELSLGIMLVVNIKSAIASQTATWLLAFFTALLIAKISEGEKISCNCFGSLTNGYIDWTTVLRNLILMAVSIGVTTYYTPDVVIKKEKKEKPFFRSIETKRWFPFLKKNFLLTLFFFLAVQSIILSLQNAGLKDNLSLLMMDKETVQPGDPAQPVEALDLGGKQTQIKFDKGVFTLLCVFSAKCEPCKINFSNWIKLSQILKNSNVEIIGIGVNPVDDLLKFEREYKPGFNLFSCADLKFKTDYKAYTTPQTIVIGKDGKIIDAYPGILNQINTNKLFGDLGITLKQ